MVFEKSKIRELNQILTYKRHLILFTRRASQFSLKRTKMVLKINWALRKISNR